MVGTNTAAYFKSWGVRCHRTSMDADGNEVIEPFSGIVSAPGRDIGIQGVKIGSDDYTVVYDRQKIDLVENDRIEVMEGRDQGSYAVLDATRSGDGVIQTSRLRTI